MSRRHNRELIKFRFFPSVPWERVNWTTSIFLGVINLMAVTMVPAYLWFFGWDLFLWVLFLAMFILTGMSITLGYHRLFAHLSFKAKVPVKLATLIFGACAFENSALAWCSDHRKHHKHVDHDDDPYDISKGFFWAHIGWLIFKLGPEMPMDNVGDLRRDRLVMWQHRWHVPIALGVGLLLPAALGYAWGGWNGAVGGFLIPGVLRVFAVQHCTFFINSVCHSFGKRPYSSKCSARDSLLMAFFTFGEGHHNYHHEFQHDYRNGPKATNFDPTKWVIWLLSKLGLASDLRRVPTEKILLAEMAEAEKNARKSISEKAGAAIAKVSAHRAELERAVKTGATISSKTLGRWKRDLAELVRVGEDEREAAWGLGTTHGQM